MRIKKPDPTTLARLFEMIEDCSASWLRQATVDPLPTFGSRIPFPTTHPAALQPESEPSLQNIATSYKLTHRFVSTRKKMPRRDNAPWSE